MDYRWSIPMLEGDGPSVNTDLKIEKHLELFLSILPESIARHNIDFTIT